ELVADTPQRVRISAESHRTVFVFTEAGYAEIRQAHCLDEARADAAGKGPATKRQDRQSGPQRVAAGGMRIVGRCVEEQVTAALARQMLGEGQVRREHKARGIDTPVCGLA